MYLLDTNACIRILNDTCPPLVARLRRESPRHIRLCSVVKAELHYGARRSSRVADNLRLLERFFSAFVSVGFDDRCADHYGSIRADLDRAETPIGPNDLLIAAIARANDLTVVTHNTDEFGRVIALRVEDWES